MKTSSTSQLVFCSVMAALGTALTGSRLSADDKTISFARDVRPILSNACFHCHGPDEDAREAELRLDQQDGLFQQRDGLTVVEPGDTAKSELIRRIYADDPDEVMPPPDSNKSLSPAQRQVLADWVRQGASWQQHWSFSKPTRPDVPQLSDDAWCQNEIDTFILKKLRASQLAPSPQAEPYILVRRVYLDLIGLPPTPAEADKWIAKLCAASDPEHVQAINETAWQELITELLASPHYGERWARRWLDLARYADTNGYEKDRDRSIWPYRDWVIDAINSGMPYDQFTVEQLAGDMLPNATIEQRVATGFHRNTMLNEEGGIDPLEFRFHAMTDRVATTGTTWLGLTLGCCQCHTHKYDPISHHDYYQLMAFLNNADEPALELPDPQIDAQWQKNLEKAEELTRQLPEKWPVDAYETLDSRLITVVGDGGQKFAEAKSGTVEVSGSNPDRTVYTVEYELPNARFETVRLKTPARKGRPGPGRTAHGNFVLSEIDFQVAAVGTQDDAFVTLPVTAATASVEQQDYELKKAYDEDDSTGWAISGPKGVPKSAEATFSIDTAVLQNFADSPLRLKVILTQQHGEQHTIESFQLSAARQRSPAEIQQLRETEIAAAFAGWRTAEKPNAAPWNVLVPTKATADVPILTIEADHSIFASGDTAKRDDYFITFNAVDYPVTALRLEALPDDRLPAGGPGSTYYEGTLGDFFLNELQVTSGDLKLPLTGASETYARNRYGSNPVSAALALDGDVQTGWSVHDRQRERHVAVFWFKEPVPPGTPLQIQMTFGRHFASSLGRFRFSATDVPGEPQARTWSEDVAELLRRPESALTAEHLQLLMQTFLLSTPKLAQAAEQIRRLQQPLQKSTSLVLAERPSKHPRPTFRHHRGEYLQPRDQVEPRLPEALAADTEARPQNRLEFARWLVSKQNPLTARVVVNRHWAAFFGTGLVKTLDDFGLQGDVPSHPELLDWLAVSFMEDDHWHLKDLHRRIVSSATYRQAAAVNPKAATVDPENRLLSYSPRFRLEAEIVRDQLLVAAGVFSEKIGGPPVRPPQPGGVTEAAYGRPRWTASNGPDRYRRSIYTFAKRTAPFAMLATFDAPSGEACIAARNRSNSPLQALTLLNDVMLMDLARKAGRRLSAAAESSDDTTQLIDLFRSVLVRPPTADELKLLNDFLLNQKVMFAASPESARQLLAVPDNEPTAAEKMSVTAAWTAVARAVFGLDESMNRE